MPRARREPIRTMARETQEEREARHRREREEWRWKGTGPVPVHRRVSGGDVYEHGPIVHQETRDGITVTHYGCTVCGRAHCDSYFHLPPMAHLAYATKPIALAYGTNDIKEG